MSIQTLCSCVALDTWLPLSLSILYDGDNGIGLFWGQKELTDINCKPREQREVVCLLLTISINCVIWYLSLAQSPAAAPPCLPPAK